MLHYKFTAVSRDGQYIKSTWSGDKHDAFVEMLKNQDIFLVRYKESRSTPFKFLSRSKHLNELVFAFHQLAQLSKSGILLIDSIKIITHTIPHAKMRGIFLEIQNTVNRGEKFATAFGKHVLFDRVIVCLLHQADHTGNYTKALHDIHDYLALQLKTFEELKSALRYPFILLCVVVVILFTLFYNVIPEAKKFFDILGLPKNEHPLIFTLSESGWSTLMVLAGAGALLVVLYKIVRFTLKGHAPIWRYGLIYVLFSLKRDLGLYFRNLALFTEHGLPLMSALNESMSLIHTKALQKDLQQIPTWIQQGIPLSEGFKNLKTLDPILVFILKTGEKSGCLNESLLCAATYLLQSYENRLKSSLKWIEPIGLSLVASLLLLLFWTVFLPIYEHASTLDI